MSARNFIKLRGELADGCKVFQVAAELGVSAGLKAKGSGTRLRKSGQAASATPRRVASETTSTRKGAKK